MEIIRTGPSLCRNHVVNNAILIKLEPSDRLEDIAAYSHFTVQELIKEVEEILKRKECNE